MQTVGIINISAPKSRQRGNLLVTAAITLGIMAIIGIGAMKGFDKYQDAKVNNDQQELADLKSKTVNYGQSIGAPFDSTNSSLSALAGLNFFDKKNVSGTGASTTVSNQWGGSITVAPGTLNTSGDAIDYTYTGVSSYGCKGIGNKFDSIASRISVGGSVVKALGSPTNVVTLATQCDAAADNATIVYTLSR